MKIIPNPEKTCSCLNSDKVTYIKPTVKNKNIIVGDFSYFAGEDFESRVTHHYDFIGDKLIIGKFCQIGKGVEFIMNGANHKLNAATTFPFYIFEGWEQKPHIKDLTNKGDTVVGNDVWIGQNVTILSGVHIGDGAIIGANSVVAKDIPPYSVAVGNPACVKKQRFDSELTDLLLVFRWWDKSIEEINALIPLLTCSDLSKLKTELKKLITEK